MANNLLKIRIMYIARDKQPNIIAQSPPPSKKSKRESRKNWCILNP